MSTNHYGPRYTRFGSPNVERRIGAMVAQAAGLVAKHFHPRELRALVLLGGYGRGEGGIYYDNDLERPHNNIDLLLITTPWGALRKHALKQRLDDVLRPIVEQEEIGIDTGVISALELQNAHARVIWFDLRWGHRTILGDASLIPALPPLTAAEIEIDDIHNLLVNRASLLVINDAIIERGIASANDARFITKHLMKAIIGHGDVFLFLRGRYHASYLEKQKRMREFAAMVPDLAELYEIASTFRFAPDYEQYMNCDLVAYTEHIRVILAQTYRDFELFQAGRGQAGNPELKDRGFHSKSWLRAICTGHHARTLLARTLPTVLHDSNDEQRQRTQRLLAAEASTPSALRKAYLRHWSRYGDPNFSKTAHQLGLSLDEAREP